VAAPDGGTCKISTTVSSLISPPLKSRTACPQVITNRGLLIAKSSCYLCAVVAMLATEVRHDRPAQPACEQQRRCCSCLSR
jgi:hypothetical protein